MNSKTAKLIRAYVNQLKAEGDAIVLKDFKRRYEMLPESQRSEVKKQMAKYLAEMRIYDPAVPTPGQLRRRGKARLKVVQGGIRPRNPILQVIARLMGIAGAGGR